MVRKLALVATAAALISAPAAAQADRTSAPASDAQEMGNGENRGGGLILGLLALAAIIAAIIIAVGGDDNDQPLSA